MSIDEARANIPSDSFSSSRIKVIQFSHTWTIENFSFFLDKKVFSSPNFSAGVNDGTRWRLKLYPKGDDEESADYISLGLCLRSCSGSGARAKSEISILGTQQKTITLDSGDEPEHFETGSYWGWDDFVLRDTLLTNKHSYLVDDKLIVRCKVSYSLDNEPVLKQISQTQPSVPGCDLSGVFGAMLERQTLPDVVLELSENEFHAHMAILAARSPVFEAMFKQNLKVEKTSRVKISGMDEETLSELLRFIYTGKSESLDRMTNLLATIGKHVSEVTSPVSNPSKENSAETTYTGEQTCAANLGTTRASDFERNSREDQSKCTTLEEEQHPDDFPLNSIRKFNGDEGAFYGWWLDFRTAVHDRRDLSFGQKLTHLKNLLEGEAAKEVRGAAHEKAKYIKKLGSLFIRFGNIRATPIEMILRSLEMSKDASVTEDGQARTCELEKIYSHPNSASTSEPKKIRDGRSCANAIGDRRSIHLRSPSSNQLNHLESRPEKSSEYWSGDVVADALKRSKGPLPLSNAQLQGEVTFEELRNSPPFFKLLYPPSESHFGLAAAETEFRLANADFCEKCFSGDHTGENCTSQIRCWHCSGNHYNILCANAPDTPSDSGDDDSDASASPVDPIPL